MNDYFQNPLVEEAQQLPPLPNEIIISELKSEYYYG